MAEHDLPAHPLVEQGTHPSAARLHNQSSSGWRPALGSLEGLGQGRMRYPQRSHATGWKRRKRSDIL